MSVLSLIKIEVLPLKLKNHCFCCLPPATALLERLIQYLALLGFYYEEFRYSLAVRWISDLPCDHQVPVVVFHHLLELLIACAWDTPVRYPDLPDPRASGQQTLDCRTAKRNPARVTTLHRNTDVQDIQRGHWVAWENWAKIAVTEKSKISLQN